MDSIISGGGGVIRTVKHNTSLTPGAPDLVRAEYICTYIYICICIHMYTRNRYIWILQYRGGGYPHCQAQHLAHARHPGPDKGSI